MPGDPTNYRKLVENAVTAMGVVSGVIAAHKERFASEAKVETKDFVDHYLEKIENKAGDSFTGL